MAKLDRQGYAWPFRSTARLEGVPVNNSDLARTAYNEFLKSEADWLQKLERERLYAESDEGPGRERGEPRGEYDAFTERGVR